MMVEYIPLAEISDVSFVVTRKNHNAAFDISDLESDIKDESDLEGHKKLLLSTC